MEKRSVIRSASVVSAFTSLSRLLGLVRDVMMAGFFGTSLVMSAFAVAFTVPNLFRRLFGEGALSSALVPVLVETREKQGNPAAWALVNRVLILLAAFLTIVAVGVVITVANLQPESAKIAAIFDLLQIMMPYVVFICLAAVSMGILNAFHHFAVSSFAPAILNILWIGTLLFVVPHIGESPEQKIQAVAWAVLLAGVLQWAIQWPVLRHFGWRLKIEDPEKGQGISHIWRDPAVKRVLRLMGPAALGMAVLQLNVMVDRLLAMWVSAEAPSALFFSERLIYFPLGIIATALGTVLLPAFSSHAARGDQQKIREGIGDGVRQLLFIMIPAAVGLLVLGKPIVQMIFEWKEFGSGSTAMTSIALQCYAPGLVVFGLAKVFVPAFYAQQDTRTPVKIGMMAVGINFVLNILFILTLPQAIKHAGLAFATVLSSAVNMTCLAVILQRRIGQIDWRGIGQTATRSLIAAAFMGAAAYFVQSWISIDGKMGQIYAVGIGITAAAIVYLAVCIGLRAPELREFLKAIRR